jgi:hypothetical protein
VLKNGVSFFFYFLLFKTAQRDSKIENDVNEKRMIPIVFLKKITNQRVTLQYSIELTRVWLRYTFGGAVGPTPVGYTLRRRAVATAVGPTAQAPQSLGGIKGGLA